MALPSSLGLLSGMPSLVMPGFVHDMTRQVMWQFAMRGKIKEEEQEPEEEDEEEFSNQTQPLLLEAGPWQNPGDAGPAHAPVSHVGSGHFPAGPDHCSLVHAGPGHDGPQGHAPDPATQWQLQELPPAGDLMEDEDQTAQGGLVPEQSPKGRHPPHPPQRLWEEAEAQAAASVVLGQEIQRLDGWVGDLQSRLAEAGATTAASVSRLEQLVSLQFQRVTEDFQGVVQQMERTQAGLASQLAGNFQKL
jgi:hypothetical protein